MKIEKRSAQIVIEHDGMHVSFELSPSIESTADLGNSSPDQQRPVDWYVYGHYDDAGNLFYVGKGKDRRAWSTDRHAVWRWYVERHLQGHYQVRIIADTMSEADAEAKEESWISQQGANLVNWISSGRQFDYAGMERYWELRRANEVLMVQAKALEKTDATAAIEAYIKAIENAKGYAFMHNEGGLVGRLNKEMDDEAGYHGVPGAIDRLTLLLCRQGRVLEAQEAAAAYFKTFRGDITYKAHNVIAARLAKALAKLKGAPPRTSIEA